MHMYVINNNWYCTVQYSTVTGVADKAIDDVAG